MGKLTVNGTRECSLDSCQDPAVIHFAQRELCLHHFLFRCYEDLDRLDARTRGSQLDRSGAATLKGFVEECSQCALEVSLTCERLDNLQRARLLDILLWAGELFQERRGLGRSLSGSSVCLPTT